MVDFTTLKGLAGYREVYPDVFSGMSDTDATRVVEAAHSSVLEGWEPTTAEMRSLAADVLRPGPSRMSPEEISAMVGELTGANPQTA